MPTRSAMLGLLVLGILAVGIAAPQGWGRDVEKETKETKPASRKTSDRARFAQLEPDFIFWKQKAELELEVLQAQVEAKKAEILLREAEFHMKRRAPDLAVLTKLDRPIAMSFPTGTPLEDVLKYVKKATTDPTDEGIPIYVEPMGLQRAEVTMSSPITMDLEGVPLRTSLRLALKQLGLAYTVKSGLLTISVDPNQ